MLIDKYYRVLIRLQSLESTQETIIALSCASRTSYAFRVFHSSISRRYTLEHELIVKAWSLTDFPGLPGGPRLPWLPGGPCQTRLKQGVKQIKLEL